MSVANIGAAVSSLPVPSQADHVYHMLAAGIEFHQLEFNAELCIVTTNVSHIMSESVNL